MQTEPPVVHAEVSLAEDVLSLGEPIVLRYTFVVTQAEGVSLYMGRDKTGWITFTLTDVGWEPCPIHPRPAYASGRHS